MIVVIRPQPGCDATVAAARLIGLAAEAWPLFALHPLAWDAPDAGGFDALLIGSANALRHAGPQLAALRTLPIHAVGAASAEAARAAGFAVTTTGGSDLQAIVAGLPPARLLRLCGRENTPLAPPAGVTIEQRTVYASEPVAMPEALAARLRQGALVLLHSGLAARHFAAECDRLAVPRAAVSLAALAPRIAAAAGPGWATAHAASRPADPALLALAAEMCQKRAGSHVQEKR